MSVWRYHSASRSMPPMFGPQDVGLLTTERGEHRVYLGYQYLTDVFRAKGGWAGGYPLRPGERFRTDEVAARAWIARWQAVAS